VETARCCQSSRLKHVALGEFAQKQYGHRRVHKKVFASTDRHASNTVVAAVAHVAAADHHPAKLKRLLPPRILADSHTASNAPDLF
jgi:hypothetical protein